MKTKLLLMALAATMGAATANATDYYASPTGTSSTATSYSTPGNITTLRGKLKAGDTLYLLGGQYDLKATLSLSKSGEADNYITICSCTGEKAVLDFRQTTNGTVGVKLSGDYVHIKNLTIRYAGGKGIWNEGGKYCILENLDVYGCCEVGIQHRSGGHNMIINCDSHDNFDYQASGGNADGFADKQGNACPGNIYIGCRAWNNSDDGWDSYQRVTDGTPTVYVNCIAYANGPETFDLSSYPRVMEGGKDADLAIFSGADLANYSNNGNPNGFKVGGKGTAHNVELYRCLSVGHRGKGFDQNNNAGNMKIINCTAYKNKNNYGFGNNYAYTLTIRNCISLAPTGGSGSSYHFSKSSSGTVNQSNNTWLSGFAASESDFESLDYESLILADRNADGTLPETLLLRLKSTATNLIDKGVDFTGFEGEKIAGYVGYKGTAPDLGCYEYGGSTDIQSVERPAQLPGSAAPKYNLSGQRVGDDYRGVVVQYGQKFVQK